MSFILVSHWEECRVLSVWPQYYLTLIIEWLSVNQIILCLKENPLDYRKTSPQVPASVCNTSLPQLLMMRGSLENKLPHLPQLSSPWWFVAASVTCCRKVHGSHFVLTKQQCNTPRSRCFIGNRCTFQWHLSVSGKLGWLYVYNLFLVRSKKCLCVMRTSLQLAKVHRELRASRDLWKSSGSHQYLLQHNNNSCRLPNQRKQSNTIIRLLWTRAKNSDRFVIVEKCQPHSSLLHVEVFPYSSGLWDAWFERLRVCECVCYRRMVSQAAMRGQRVVESECRCWNPAVWLLVSLLGSFFLVAVSVLLRFGECMGWGRGYHVGLVQN